MYKIKDYERNTGTTHWPRLSGVQLGVLKKLKVVIDLCDSAYLWAVFSFKEAEWLTD